MTTLIPRGGTCPACKTYTLWGDVIRGCYRRFSVSTGEGGSGLDDADMKNLGSATPSSAKQKRRKPARTRQKKKKATSEHIPSEDGEVFDIDNISCSSAPSSPLDQIAKQFSEIHLPRDKLSSSITRAVTTPGGTVFDVDEFSSCESEEYPGNAFDVDENLENHGIPRYTAPASFTDPSIVEISD